MGNNMENGSLHKFLDRVAYGISAEQELTFQVDFDLTDFPRLDNQGHPNLEGLPDLQSHSFSPEGDDGSLVNLINGTVHKTFFVQGQGETSTWMEIPPDPTKRR